MGPVAENGVEVSAVGVGQVQSLRLCVYFVPFLASLADGRCVDERSDFLGTCYYCVALKRFSGRVLMGLYQALESIEAMNLLETCSNSSSSAKDLAYLDVL